MGRVSRVERLIRRVLGGVCGYAGGGNEGDQGVCMTVAGQCKESDVGWDEESGGKMKGG